MPRDASGYYTLPSSNPVAPDTVIESAWANETMEDIALQLNNVLTADGSLGFTGPALFVDGTAGAPGIAFKLSPGTGIYRNSSNSGLGFSSSGTQIMGMHNLGITVPGVKKGLYAEMTDSNIQNRFTFVTSQANKNTVLQIAPNGTGDPAGRGAALLVLSNQQDPANFYGMAVGAGDVGTGISRCALRLFKVGTVPDIPMSLVVNEQVLISMYENNIITIGNHTPAAWGQGSAHNLRFIEIGKAGWSVGSNLVATPEFYAIATVCNAYTDGTNWKLAAASPYGAGKASAALLAMRGDQAIFALNTNTATAADSVVSWSPSMVVDWSTLGDNRLGVYGQVRAWQFVATDSV